ncbi:M16 family metallopeptidase [Chromobacterium paludis]|nr:pitrilysin family protein [Chromobacterium paludis]
MRLPALGLLLALSLGAAPPSQAAADAGAPEARAEAAIPAPGENFDPSPANIERRTERLALANGARLALLPKSTRGHTVNGYFSFVFGDAEQLAGQGQIARLTAAMLNQGVAGLDRTTLAHRLGQLQSSLHISGSGQEVRVGFASQRDTLPALLDLIAAQLQRPSFPPEAFERLRQQRRAELENQRRNPQAVAAQTLAHRMNRYGPGDIRYIPTLDEELASLRQVKLAQLRRFHQRFYGADHARLVVVGDFDAAAVRRQLSRQYGAWRSSARYRPLAPRLQDKPAGVQALRLASAGGSAYLAAQPLVLRDTAEDYPALLLANQILGGESRSRLFQRAHQTQDAAEGIRSTLRADSAQNAGLWRVAIAGAPRDLTEWQAGLDEAMRRLLEEGVSELEVAAAKHALLQDAQLARAQDDTLSLELNRQLAEGRTMDFVEKLENRIRQASVAQVNAALRRHLRPRAWSAVYAGVALPARPLLSQN